MSPRRAMPAAIAAAYLLAACRVGQTVDNSALVRRPEGAESEIVAGAVSFRAELLAVQNSGLVLLRGDTVIFVAYRSIKSGEFKHVDAVIADGQAPDGETASALRLASRFPQGISTELEKRLLAAYHQSAMVVVTQ